jgi:hypothetical protein
MGRKKQTNAVVDGKNNGGLHSTRRLAVVKELITTNGLKDAVMYQFILSGSNRKEYQATLKALVRHIRTKCRAEYVGGYEVGDEKGGEHAHAFFIIEAADYLPSDLLDVREGGFIARRIKRKAKQAKEAGLEKTLSIRIEPPKNVMHGGAMFARMNTPAKLADCIKWCSYHIKKRSKDDVTDREIYFGSEFASNVAKREAKRQKYRDALTKSSRPTPAAPASTEGDKMTPAEKFIATKYEEAVDQQLDVEAVRLHLLAHGIKRTPAQVAHELEDVYGFYQYASSHPPKPFMSAAEWDRTAYRIR